MTENTTFHDESQVSAKAASEAIDAYYNRSDQPRAFNDAIGEDDGYSALRWILAKAVEKVTPTDRIAELVGGYDETRAAFSALPVREQYGPAHEIYDDAIYDFAHEIAELLRPGIAARATPLTVAELDGTVDEADWLSEGHVLDAHEVAYLRSLIVPKPSTE